MKIQKKILARETLIFFSFILLILIFYSCTRIWNWNQRKKIQVLETELITINSIVRVEDSIIETFRNPNKIRLYSSMSQKGLYSKSYEDFRMHFCTKEIVKKLYDNLINDFSLNNMNFDDFVSTFFADINRLPILFESIKKRENTIGESIIKESTIKSYHESLIYGKKTLSTILYFTYFIFFVVYILRGAFFSIKWSIKTLKEQ